MVRIDIHVLDYRLMMLCMWCHLDLRLEEPWSLLGNDMFSYCQTFKLLIKYYWLSWLYKISRIVYFLYSLLNWLFSTYVGIKILYGIRYDFVYDNIYVDTALYFKCWWNTCIEHVWSKVKGLLRIFLLFYFSTVLLRKPCMALCGIIYLWLRCLLYYHYTCVYYGLEGKLMNIWMCGYDDYTIFNLCLVFYSSCESRICS